MEIDFFAVIIFKFITNLYTDTDIHANMSQYNARDWDEE
jgi:hypothetical protein